MAHYTDLLFDFDGTLADTVACCVQATQAAFTTHGLAVPARQAIVDKMGVPIEASFLEWGEPGMPMAQRDRLIATFCEAYEALETMAVLPCAGMPELLAELHHAGRRMAVVTSKPSAAARRIGNRLGIGEFLAHIVGSDMVANYKPHPETAFKALALLGVAASPAVLVVGDSSHDIRMGASAGLATCAVSWGAHGHDMLVAAQPTHLVASAAELRALLLE